MEYNLNMKNKKLTKNFIENLPNWFLWIMILAFMWVTGISAVNALDSSSAANGWNIQKAHQKYEQLKAQRMAPHVNLFVLEKGADTLSRLISHSDECTEEATKQQNNINTLIQQGSVTEKILPQQGVDLIYLQKEQKNWMNRQAQCRLLAILAKEELGRYKSAITELKQAQALSLTPPIWMLSEQVWRWVISPWGTDTITEKYWDIPDLDISIEWMTSIPFLALAFAWFILWIALKSHFFQRHVEFKKIKVLPMMLLTGFFVTLFLVFHELDFKSPATIWYRWSLTGCLYLLSVSLFLLFFKIKKIKSFFQWNGLSVGFFQRLGLILLSGSALVRGFRDFINTASFGDFVTQWLQACCLFIVLILGLYFLFSFCRLHRNLHFVKRHRILIESLGTLLLVGCIILNILGYQVLAYRLTTSTLLSLGIIFLTIMIIHGIAKLYHTFTAHVRWQDKLHRFFGYQSQQVIFEFVIMKFVFQSIVVALSLFLIGQCWDFATDFVDSLFVPIFDGIHWSNMTFYPARMVMGIVVFCFVYLLFRAISTRISRYHQFQEEEDTQVAVASIIIYLGFGAAVITGLLIAGFDFTGLAIVAGALSVGIGLGLQSIVNNFVSGLILLIEKPIRPGDRISVDNVEGFVKKIRVRSTQITTPFREDIIIPNSDLITRRVTNFMFSDTYGRISCEVGVAYDADAELVRTLLLQVANAHDEIVKTKANQPTVIFRAFGENKLIFQLCGMIKDVNKKSLVQSELNFSINALFREHHVHFPVTQPVILGVNA